MAPSHESCLPSSIMFAGEDEMHSNLLVVLANGEVLPFVKEGIIVVDLTEFLVDRLLPQVILVFFIQFHSLSVVAWDLDSKHVDRLVAMRMKLGFVGHAN